MISPIAKKPMTSAAITLDWAICAREMLRILAKMVRGGDVAVSEERVALGVRRAATSWEKVALNISALLRGVSVEYRELGDME